MTSVMKELDDTLVQIPCQYDISFLVFRNVFRTLSIISDKATFAKKGNGY